MPMGKNILVIIKLIKNMDKYYIGFWKDGKQNGMAKFIKDNQIRYGIWKEGKKEKWFKNKEEFIINLNPTEEKYFNLFMWDTDKINEFFDIEIKE